MYRHVDSGVSLGSIADVPSSIDREDLRHTAGRIINIVFVGICALC